MASEDDEGVEYVRVHSRDINTNNSEAENASLYVCIDLNTGLCPTSHFQHLLCSHALTQERSSRGHPRKN